MTGGASASPFRFRRGRLERVKGDRRKIEPGRAAAFFFVLNNFGPLGFPVDFYRVCLTCCQCMLMLPKTIKCRIIPLRLRFRHR